MSIESRRSEIYEKLNSVQRKIEAAAIGAGRDPREIELIVVTKNFPLSDSQILYDLGVRNFGENRAEEGAIKSAQLPAEISWHFQGQIQSRKIKAIASWASSVHSLDSLDHARKFATFSEGKVRDFFIQVNLEPQRVDRGGVALSDLENLLTQIEREMGITPVGLMTVAPLGALASEAFSHLRQIQLGLKREFPALNFLSMGMSGDFEEAIRAGATHLRVGSSILGSRLLPA